MVSFADHVVVTTTVTEEGLVEALLRPQDRVVALAGAGGKTSFMFLLARILVRRQNRVITTTTTRIRWPASHQSPAVVLLSEGNILARLERALACHGQVTVAERVLPGKKLAGVASPLLADLWAHSSATHLLIEADGARGLSLKAPAAWEPVVPSWCDVFVGLAGLDVVGQPLNEQIVFRPERVSVLTRLQLGARLTTEAIARLAVHPQGMLRGCPASGRSCILLNKIEDSASRELARTVITRAGQLPGIKPALWVFGSVFEKTFQVVGR